jgi:acyl transferase domain-containing protein
LVGSRTAVAIGISTCDYARLAKSGLVDAGPYASTGNALSVAANRISYALDLRGPSWTVDTACSSSLVALHQACGSLRQGECDAALVGGTNLILVPELSEAFAQTGMLSPDGVCRTFDKEANGYVRGEGVAVVVLKRLSDARRDGDRVEAVVRGTAVNQDGRSNGLTAPNGPAQQAVIREALQAAGVEPHQIGLVEAHGTGTPLGDPIELNALMEVLEEGRAPEDICWIGSVKANVGHLEAAAGIAGIIKTVLSLKHRQIVPQVHFRVANPHIAIASKPFCIAERATEWDMGTQRRLAGVSSFGFGGTNSHAVLAEAPQGAERSFAQPFAGILAFSARTPEALRALRTAYAEFLATHPEVRLDDFAWTVNRSRSLFFERAAVIFHDREDLLLKLRENDIGRATDGPEHLQQLATQYLQGEKIDFSVLHGGQLCEPVPLPTYPFERKRYWMKPQSKDGHPLLGCRLKQQAHEPEVWSWEAGFHFDSFRGRRQNGLMTLPYSTYVEMALSAAAEIAPDGKNNNSPEVSRLTLPVPLLLREGESRRVQTVLIRRGTDIFSFAVYQHATDRSSGAANWEMCASAEVRTSTGGSR